MDKKWEAGRGMLPSLLIPAGFCAGSQNLTHFYIKKIIFKQEKCQIISSLWLCIYNWRAFPSSIYFIYTHNNKKVFLCVCV